MCPPPPANSVSIFDISIISISNQYSVFNTVQFILTLEILEEVERGDKSYLANNGYPAVVPAFALSLAFPSFPTLERRD